MHWAFKNASAAFGAAKGEDSLYNDATWAVTYVDSHDYVLTVRKRLVTKVVLLLGQKIWT